ncbi:MAG: hypothetical protein AAF039_01435 [Bacteroidota bacterium]
MDNNLNELTLGELQVLNGGGWLYDLYRIVVSERDDFVNGFNDGLKNGIF